MYIVKKLEPKGSRMHVYLDNNVDFLLYKGEMKKFNIQDGTCIDEKQYQSIMEILYKRARERALYILDDAYKTKKQIIDKLKSGFYPTLIIDKVIEYLSEYDLINDNKYAAMYIDYKSDSKSKRQIIQDLHSKGVSKDIIDRAFENVDFSDDNSLRKIIEKRFNRYNLKEKKDLEKFYRYLVGKGYSFGDIKKVLSDFSDDYNIFDD